MATSLCMSGGRGSVSGSGRVRSGAGEQTSNERMANMRKNLQTTPEPEVGLKKIFFKFNFIIYLFIFRAAPTAYGGSQTRGLIGATDAGLCHSYSNARSEPRLQPTPQLMAMLDP